MQIQTTFSFMQGMVVLLRSSWCHLHGIPIPVPHNGRTVSPSSRLHICNFCCHRGCHGTVLGSDCRQNRISEIHCYSSLFVVYDHHVCCTVDRRETILSDHAVQKHQHNSDNNNNDNAPSASQRISNSTTAQQRINNTARNFKQRQRTTASISAVHKC